MSARAEVHVRFLRIVARGLARAERDHQATLAAIRASRRPRRAGCTWRCPHCRSQFLTAPEPGGRCARCGSIAS